MSDRQALIDAHEDGVITMAEYQALRLHLEGYGYRRIAVVLDISITTARDRIKRGNRKLEEADR